MIAGALDEYRRVTAGKGGTFPLRPRALWRLTGPDALRYLNGQLTSDVSRLAEGHGTFGAICTGKGRMEGDVSVARHGEAFYLDADFSQREALGARLDKYLIADDAQFEDLSDDWQQFHVFGSDPTPVQQGFIVRYARFGLPGFDVWLPHPSEWSEGPVISAEVVETIRIEHAIPKWGAELTTSTLPPEAGPRMLAAISYTKGCYVGQEVIARLKSVGHVNRSLVLLKSGAETVPGVGAKLTREGKEIGSVTSSGHSPAFGGGIALGYVQRQFTAEGTTVDVDGVELTVVAPQPAQA